MGKQQAAQLGKLFAAHFSGNEDRCHVVSSGLLRAVDTCEAMVGHRDFERDPELNERRNGDYGGIMSMNRFDRIRKNPPVDFESRFNQRGGQTDRQHQIQAVTAVRKHLLACPADKIPVLVSHSGTMRHTAQAMGVRTAFENAGLYHCKPDEQHPGKWKITQVKLLESGKTIEVPVTILQAQQAATGMSRGD